MRGSGLGLFAIHDDEDVAEVKGVPTFRYKLAAFALSAGIAGAVGGIHAMYVGFVTVAETFEITVPLYVVLMSVLGRRAPLAGAGDRRHRHHRLALRLHQRRRGDHGPRHRRPDPDRRHPVAARRRHSGHPGLAEAPPRTRRCATRRRSGAGRAGGRDRRIGERSILQVQGRRRSASAACRRWPASTSTCARARSSAWSGPTARARPR